MNFVKVNEQIVKNITYENISFSDSSFTKNPTLILFNKGDFEFENFINF